MMARSGFFPRRRRRHAGLHGLGAARIETAAIGHVEEVYPFGVPQMLMFDCQILPQAAA